MVEVCAVFCYCLDTIYVCIWRMFDFMSVVVIVWASVRTEQKEIPQRFTLSAKINTTKE